MKLKLWILKIQERKKFALTAKMLVCGKNCGKYVPVILALLVKYYIHT